MRLFEAINDVADTIAEFFRNKIGVADNAGQPLEIPYNDPELINFMHSQGLGELNYDSLDSLLKKPENQDLKSLVRSWDSESIKLKTKVGSEDQEQNLMPNSSAGKSVDQMAHNVVAKDK